MGSNDISELLKLDADERIAIAEQLWASVANEQEIAAASAAENAFIDARLDEYLRNPSDTVPWAEVKKGLGL